MTIKINSFIIPNNTIKQMEYMLDKSLFTGKEHGFNLCLNKDKIIKPGKFCEGSKCSMDISEFTCEENQKTIGIYHTHRNMSNPSMSDLSTGYLVGMNCIGSPREIKCFRRKKDFDGKAFADIKIVQTKEEQTKLDHSRWKNKEISIIEYSNIYSEYKKEVDRIIKDHFEEIKLR